MTSLSRTCGTESLHLSGFTSFDDATASFFQRFPHLQEAEEMAFIRECVLSVPVDGVIFFTGRFCVEDFMEIVLLCGNGYGAGALKILRGMYERAVTACYLHQHPEEVEAFLNFYWVDRHRLA